MQEGALPPGGEGTECWQRLRALAICTPWRWGYLCQGQSGPSCAERGPSRRALGSPAAETQRVRGAFLRIEMRRCFLVETYTEDWSQTLLTWDSGVLTAPAGSRPLLLSSNSLPGERSLLVLSIRPGDFSRSRGRPGDLSLRSSVRPSRSR